MCMRARSRSAASAFLTRLVLAASAWTTCRGGKPTSHPSALIVFRSPFSLSTSHARVCMSRAPASGGRELVCYRVWLRVPPL
jgi:hypothetical protein